MKKRIPFAVRREDGVPLVRQVLDGMRDAIVGGYYAPGDALPPYAELAETLGVSQIVTKTALKRLVAEGFVAARPRVGSVVRDRGVKQWRGHVVFVCPDLDVGYFQTLLAETLRTRLNREGYLFTRASVEHRDAAGTYDLSLLDAALARSVDLVVILYNRPAIFRHVAKRGVPYMVVGNLKEAPDGAIGLTQIDFNKAVPEFVDACRATGVRKVVQFRLPEPMCDATPALRAAGIAATNIILKYDFAKGKLFSIEESGRIGLEKLAVSRRLGSDTLLFFTSDYLARGGLLAMERHGLKAPEDIQVVAFANSGLGPAYFRELTRMEINPVAAGTAMANACLKYLSNGIFATGPVIGPEWKKGETMGNALY